MLMSWVWQCLDTQMEEPVISKAYRKSSVYLGCCFFTHSCTRNFSVSSC